jgi:hypothetical protein
VSSIVMLVRPVNAGMGARRRRPAPMTGADRDRIDLLPSGL